MSKVRPKRINCVLIAGGQWHDFDFARLELLIGLRRLFGRCPGLRLAGALRD